MTEENMNFQDTQPFPTDGISQQIDGETEQRSFFNRLSDSIGTFVSEISNEDRRARKVGAFALAGVTQALDRGRMMVLVLPETFDQVLTHANEQGWNGWQTATASGVAVGGVFAAWGWIVGRAFHTSLNEFPKTTEAVTENHPVMVSVLADAVDGFPTKENLKEEQSQRPKNGYEVDPYETRDSILGKIGLGVKRGFKTAFLFGTTAHVGIAKASEHSDESNKRRRRAVTAESAGAFAATAAGVSSMITHDFMGLAQDVRDVLTNKQLLTGSALFFIGVSALSNYVARKGALKKAEAISD